MDVINLKDEIKLLEESTLPKLLAMGKELVAALEAIVLRLDGATIQITINLRGERNEKNAASDSDAAACLPAHGADAGKTIT